MTGEVTREAFKGLLERREGREEEEEEEEKDVGGKGLPHLETPGCPSLPTCQVSIPPSVITKGSMLWKR